jgi:hypothetical protein
VLRRQHSSTAVATGTDLRHQPQALRVRVQRVADELVDDVRPVVLRGVDVVDAELDRPPQHGPRRFRIGRRAEHAGARQLHGTEPDAVDRVRTESRALPHDIMVARSRTSSNPRTP